MSQKHLLLDLRDETVTISLKFCCLTHAHEAFDSLTEQIKQGGIEIDLGLPEAIVPMGRGSSTLQ